MSLTVSGRKPKSLKGNAVNLKTPKRLVNGSGENGVLTKTKNYLNNSLKYSKNLDDLNKSKKQDEDKMSSAKNEPEMIEEKVDSRLAESSKSQDLVELDFNNLSKEEIKQKEKYFDDKLKDLGEKLRKIREMGVCSGQVMSDLKENEISESLSLCVKDYLAEINKLERDCDDKLELLSEWYVREKHEIEETFKTEKKKALQEFNDKRKELKENLLNEHEEIRKQIEIDRNTLDIHLDTAELKPPPTRNLRRRTNHNNNENDTSNHDLSSCHINLHVTSSVSSNSSLLQSASVNLASNSNLNVSNILGSNQSSYFNSTQNFYSSSSYSQYVNDRKRKIAPNMMFQLNEDDLNDDLKHLSKNLRLSHNHSPCKN
uniref:Sin3 histone deacetylase corepressor complex component SDS3 n=1 Tax=Brachionus koreanus TaxID=1199090 RepID=A0A4Y6ERB2_9BILA|nr:Sin3 histone deacetylase corepressor complex component SDS3 [Brachionus koreanus]